MPPLKIPEKPLDKIALSCSGGGYRAASYHLGTMSYLHHLQYFNKPLLENVRMISTVSGGTITGAIYALMKQDGHTFEEIYTFIMDKLQHLDLVKMSLEKISPGGSWSNPHKRRNLINAFAELYDAHYTEGRTFESFTKMNSHLKAVVFNSTDFSHGLNFRFRNAGRPLFGNANIKIPKKQALEVKIADAIASSACFPGGFEPMIWPDDFAHPESPSILEQKKSGIKAGIMDGGIFDNQGISSILTYNSSSSGLYFDLVIVSDVSSPDMTPFHPFQRSMDKYRWKDISLRKLRKFYKFADNYLQLVLFSVALIFVFLAWRSGFADKISTGIFLSISALAVICMILKWFINRSIRRITSSVNRVLNNIIPPDIRERLVHLRADDITLQAATPLIMDRVSSVVLLLSEVFLKIVRRLNYNKLYENSQYKNRIIGTLIKTLTREHFRDHYSEDRPANAAYKSKSMLRGNYDQVVGPRIREVAESAATFGTTLWFTEQDQLDSLLNKLVACGQMTMCFKMLEYLEIIILGDNDFDKLEESIRTELQLLYETCKRDWEQFREAPLWMLQQ